MSSTREIKHDPFKAWKFLVIPTIRFSYGFSLFCTMASIYTIIYFAFSSQTHVCPHCHRIIVTQKFIDNNITTGYEKTNISHIVFGIAGSTKTWNKRQNYSELWWKPNITRGFVWLDEKPPNNVTWAKTSPPYKVSGNTSRFKYTCWYGSRSAIRLARIVKESFELGLENVRWFVMGDDDTVFFTENLVTVLSKYDHNQMYYVGGNSESVEQDVIFSYTMAYGGGGFAISYPLAAQLVRILDACIDRYSSLYGSDQKIQSCLSEIGVPLTKELGFHQIDSFKNLISAYKMDPSRTLQRSFCYDLRRNWTVSVSWGYTVQLYPSLVTAKQLETAFRTFRTFRSMSNQPFTFNVQPKNPDPCERPIVYFLDRVESVGEGKTLTTYKRYVEDSEKGCGSVNYAPALAVPFVNVSASNFNPDLWNKAPRRQCCEIIEGSDWVDSGIQVNIRSCNHFESVTPP